MALGAGALLLVFIVGLCVRLYSLLKQRQRLVTLIDQIPGPPAVPILGCAYAFKLDSLEQLEEWGRKYVTCPDGVGMMRTWVGPFPVVLMCSNEAVQKVLENPKNIAKPPLMYNFLRKWLGMGLLTSYGARWHHRRKMLTSAFHFSTVNSFVPVFSKQAQVFVEQLEKFADSDAEVDLFPFIKRCALDIICGEATVTHVGLAQFRDGDGRGDWRATWTQHGVRGRGGDAEPTHLAPRTSSLDVAEARVVPLGQRLRLRRRPRHDHRLHTQGALLHGDDLALEHPFRHSRSASEPQSFRFAIPHHATSLSLRRSFGFDYSRSRQRHFLTSPLPRPRLPTWAAREPREGLIAALEIVSPAIRFRGRSTHSIRRSEDVPTRSPKPPSRFSDPPWADAAPAPTTTTTMGVEWTTVPAPSGRATWASASAWR
uniref:Cytochrome P450 n=1 Tax=Steinernema glaseri TaxID=37863 RepID=A0A1I8ASX5_9BILA